MKIHQVFDRQTISARLGGGVVAFAPNKNGVVTALCLDPQRNPGAPLVILPASGAQRSRMIDLIQASDYPIPIFIRLESRRWEYRGTFVFEYISRNRADIMKHHKGSLTPLSEIEAVIFMRTCESTNDSTQNTRKELHKGA